MNKKSLKKTFKFLLRFVVTLCLLIIMKVSRGNRKYNRSLTVISNWIEQLNMYPRTGSHKFYIQFKRKKNYLNLNQKFFIFNFLFYLVIILALRSMKFSLISFQRFYFLKQVQIETVLHFSFDLNKVWFFKKRKLTLLGLPFEELLTELFLAVVLCSSDFFSRTELPIRVLAIEPDLIDCARSDFSTFFTIETVLAKLFGKMKLLNMRILFFFFIICKMNY